MTTPRSHALVLGGTGVIGAAVVKALVERGLSTTFTFLRNEEKARTLASSSRATSMRVDLTQSKEILRLFAALDERGVTCDVLVHCAAVHASTKLTELTEEEVDHAVALTGRAAIIAVRELASRLARREVGGHVVLVTALERTQSLPLAPAFAASQGMLAPLAMSLAKELGPRNILVNTVAGGLVGKGISQHLDPKRVKDYEKLSALRRLGTPEEIAAAVVFLGLDNTYMTGKTLAANGGI